MSFSESIIRFFKPLLSNNNSISELSDPIPVRLPSLLLEEINSQSEQIGGTRYRSKHLVNLLYLGSNYYRAANDFVKNLPAEHFALLTRIHYVFNKLDLSATKVAESLGYVDSQVVSGWMDGKIYPTFTELEVFSDYYFLNSEWLKHGNDSGNMKFTPHIVQRKSFVRDVGKLYQIVIDTRNLKIETLRLIRDNTGRVLISLDYGNKRYVSLYFSALRFKDEKSVGGGGFGDLVYLAGFCKLMDEYMNSILTLSYCISEKEFDKLVSGECIPDDVGVWGQVHANHWYETIHSNSETQSLSDEQFWKGAISLFKAIQCSSDFSKLEKCMKDNHDFYVEQNYIYKDRYSYKNI